jgi:hypothetical protein
MKKTKNFFIIDNFNTVPLELLEYCEDYLIYDASIKPEVTEELARLGLNFKKIARTGHNISTYFTYFDEYYEALPEALCLTKGHMIGRHCSKEFFDRVYDNRYFTYLYEDRAVRKQSNPKVAFLAMENQYLEVNNSWYVASPEHPHRYFADFNDLLKFIYVDPVLPAYCSFAPGGCYIVLKSQVIKHSREFYLNLNKIMSYGLNPNFPSEAHQIERMLPIIFEANYPENPWMNDETAFDRLIAERAAALIENGLARKRNLVARIKSITKRYLHD